MHKSTSVLSKSLTTDGILTGDTYRLFVPIEDDLIKSVEVDENGDYIVQGVMSSEDKDEEGDNIMPDGMDCSYFLDKGWIKYEHGNNPNQFIGEPLEVKLGRFEHPTLHKSVNGIYIKGRLYAQRELAQQAVRALNDLKKSHTTRKMGWSIEGNVKERDRKTGKVVKSVLRNVVLTMNPVNTLTWAELAKSFAKNHELTCSMSKSLDTTEAAPLMPQSLEGNHKVADEQEVWVKLFREFVKEHFISKALSKEFVASTPSTIGMKAYNFALGKELDNDGAYTFASYINEKHEILKSLFRINCGGEKYMSKSAIASIASILDSDLADLQKSLEDDIEGGNEDENLEKAIGTDGTKEHEESETSEEEKKEHASGKEEDDEDNEDKDEDYEDDDMDKSIKTDFAKSFAANSENTQAFEVSDFLVNLVDELGYHMDGFEKSMMNVTKQQSTIVKSLMGFGNLVKSLTTTIEDLKADNEELRKSFNAVLERPVGRKSVVNQRELTTVQKSFGSSVAMGQPLTRNQVSDILIKSFEAGELQGSEVARFEAGVDLSNLRLPQKVKEQLGL